MTDAETDCPLVHMYLQTGSFSFLFTPPPQRKLALAANTRCRHLLTVGGLTRIIPV